MKKENLKTENTDLEICQQIYDVAKKIYENSNIPTLQEYAKESVYTLKGILQVLKYNGGKLEYYNEVNYFSNCGGWGEIEIKAGEFCAYFQTIAAFEMLEKHLKLLLAKERAQFTHFADVEKYDCSNVAKFAGTDPLRPNLQNVEFNFKRGTKTATDSRILKIVKIDKQDKETALINPLTNEIKTDATFPAWENVLPKQGAKVVLCLGDIVKKIPKKMLNQSTKQVIFEFNYRGSGDHRITGGDSDFGTSFENHLHAFCNFEQNFKIAFNINFLSKITSYYKDKKKQLTEFTMYLTASNRAVVITVEGKTDINLIIPVMIKTGYKEYAPIEIIDSVHYVDIPEVLDVFQNIGNENIVCNKLETSPALAKADFSQRCEADDYYFNFHNEAKLWENKTETNRYSGEYDTEENAQINMNMKAVFTPNKHLKIDLNEVMEYYFDLINTHFSPDSEAESVNNTDVLQQAETSTEATNEGENNPDFVIYIEHGKDEDAPAFTLYEEAEKYMLENNFEMYRDEILENYMIIYVREKQVNNIKQEQNMENINTIFENDKSGRKPFISVSKDDVINYFVETEDKSVFKNKTQSDIKRACLCKANNISIINEPKKERVLTTFADKDFEYYNNFCEKIIKINGCYYNDSYIVEKRTEKNMLSMPDNYIIVHKNYIASISPKYGYSKEDSKEINNNLDFYFDLINTHFPAAELTEEESALYVSDVEYLQENGLIEIEEQQKIKLTESDYKEIQKLSQKQDYTYSCEQLKSFVYDYKTAKETGDKYTMLFIEAILEDVNYHRENRLLQAGLFDAVANCDEFCQNCANYYECMKTGKCLRYEETSKQSQLEEFFEENTLINDDGTIYKGENDYETLYNEALKEIETLKNQLAAANEKLHNVAKILTGENNTVESVKTAENKEIVPEALPQIKERKKRAKIDKNAAIIDFFSGKEVIFDSENGVTIDGKYHKSKDYVYRFIVCGKPLPKHKPKVKEAEKNVCTPENSFENDNAQQIEIECNCCNKFMFHDENMLIDGDNNDIFTCEHCGKQYTRIQLFEMYVTTLENSGAITVMN